jgi:DNA-binding MarR family transcriptional regulator
MMISQLYYHRVMKPARRSRKLPLRSGRTAVPPLDSRAVFLLSQVGHSVASAFAQRLTGLGIQPRHFAVLHSLAALDGQSQQELADQLNIHRNVMVGLVDDLEQLGLASRQPHAEDRRAYALRLAPLGMEVVTAAHDAADQLEAVAAEVLSDAERRALIKLLKRVATHLGLQQGSHPGLSEPR